MDHLSLRFCCRETVTFRVIEGLIKKKYQNYVSWENIISCYLHAFCGVTEQTSESDGVGDCAQVDEQDGGQRLDVKRIVKVAGEKRQLPLHIQDQTSAKP